MRQPFEIPVPTAEEPETLATLYRTTRQVRLWIVDRPGRTVDLSGPAVARSGDGRSAGSRS